MTGVCNPWLDIPLDDYERHMALSKIAQARMLADQLALAVEESKPRSLALIGCAGGNGLETLIGGPSRRIVGVDIVPHYVEVTRERFSKDFPRLELYADDIENLSSRIAPVELVVAALVLEYVDVASAVASLKNLCLPGGNLVILLQDPDERIPPVSPSPYTSLERLAPFMSLKKAGDIIGVCQAAGFALLTSRQIALKSGKRFSVLNFRLQGAAT
jgi:SAM-dependent methyltransferase